MEGLGIALLVLLIPALIGVFVDDSGGTETPSPRKPVGGHVTLMENQKPR